MCSQSHVTSAFESDVNVRTYPIHW